MRISFLSFLILILFSAICNGQTPYPKNYFASPIKSELILTGNFGEIRPNHFHSGFDIKTNNIEGISIYAVADGYVSRIKVSPYGYGNALYITHPNGYTSIYAHLKSFNTAIASFTTNIQNSTLSFEFDTLLTPNQFSVKKGAFIALSGNSGGSQGPHLHFEIRDTKTEKPINPHYFGFSISDKIAPKVEKIMIYPLDENTIINGKYEAMEITPLTKKTLQTINPKDSILAGGTIGIGVECYDTDDISKNNNAVFSIELQSGGKRIYYHEMESFAFENSRYVNAHIDYEAKQKKKGSIQKCFLAKNNETGIYKDVINNGKIILKDTLEHWILLIIKDFAGNNKELSFKIKSLSPEKTPQTETSSSASQPMNCLKRNEFKRSDIMIDLPEKSLYDDINFTYKKQSNEKHNYAPIHYIHNTYTALHKNIQLAIKTNNVPDNLKNKIAIVQIADNEKLVYCAGKLDNDWLIIETKQLGNYTVTVDTTAPVIKTVFIEPKSGILIIEKAKKLQFIISDNLSGVKRYKATIDNKWVLLENDAKNNLFTLILPEDLAIGYHDLFIGISDDKGNRTTWDIFLQKK